MNVGAKIMLTGKRRLPAGAQAPTCYVRMPDGWSANRKLVVVGDKIALALVGRVAGMIEEFRTNHRNVGQPHRSSDAHSR
jgi:hypothetical protein